jgi:hypothetical protein
MERRSLDSRPCGLDDWSAIRSTYRPSRFSTRLRLLPTFLTAFFTAALELWLFFASYRTS